MGFFVQGPVLDITKIRGSTMTENPPMKLRLVTPEEVFAAVYADIITRDEARTVFGYQPRLKLPEPTRPPEFDI